ncbi:hypothetical protein [Streptomyces sp. NPDC054838]
MFARRCRHARPALAVFLTGVLMTCAYVMWGPAHLSGMATADGMGTAGPPVTADADTQGQSIASERNGGCFAMGTECPLASAKAPGPVTLVAPAPSLLPEPGLSATPAPRASNVGCGWPRAPDPVSLLCISRT